MQRAGTRARAGPRGASRTARRRVAAARALASEAVGCTRRDALGAALAAANLLGARGASAASEVPFADVEGRAKAAYNRKDLAEALECLDELVRRRPDEPVWRERRGQVLVDLKRFAAAIEDFNAVEAARGEAFKSLGLLNNRGLAYEGLAEWRNAIRDYDESVVLAEELGAAEPYVLNSRGNCHASLGEFDAALSDYRASARAFQHSKGLAGAIYADSNAALMLAQLGRDDEAMTAMRTVARRAAGSIDMRAALAAMHWSRGEEAKAEEYWGWACEKINSGQLQEGGPAFDGCALYRDADWLGRIRRWPPVMVERMTEFLALRSA